MELGGARLTHLVTHYVGNKIREEGTTLSKHELPVHADVAPIILKNYLGSIVRTGKPYSFFHESDENLNEINVFANEIFSNEDLFFGSSLKIAKHLYAKSTHPNILGGDLFVVLFDDISLNGEKSKALGIFKTEIKEKFLSVKKEDDSFILRGNEGIDPKDLQKGALIIEGNRQVFALERGHAKTTYWIDEFLKLKPAITAKTTASYMGVIVKKTVAEINDPQEVENYKTKFDELIRSDQPTVGRLEKISEKFVGKQKIEEIHKKILDQGVLAPSSDTPIEAEYASRSVTNAFKRITIWSGVDLVLSGKSSSKNIKREYSKDTGVITIYINSRDN